MVWRVLVWHTLVWRVLAWYVVQLCKVVLVCVHVHVRVCVVACLVAQCVTLAAYVHTELRTAWDDIGGTRPHCQLTHGAHQHVRLHHALHEAVAHQHVGLHHALHESVHTSMSDTTTPCKKSLLM